MITGFFNEVLYRPLYNAVVFLYNVLPVQDFGLAIIALTILVRILFFPLSIKTLRSQRELSALNPYISEIKKKFKGDKLKENEAIMNLYREHKINPLSGCLPLLIQLPIIFALYKAFVAGLNPESMDLLYSFVKNPGVIDEMFLGIIEITKKSPPLAVLAGVLQFFQAKQSSSALKKNIEGVGKEMAAMNAQMLYFLPLFIIIIGWNLPAGLILYWITTTIFSILEQFYLRKTL